MAASAMAAFLSLRNQYSAWVVDRLRSTDLDHQGHVGNTIHAVLCSNGRYDFLKRHVRPHIARTDLFALVRITIEYLGEMHYPGKVDTGTLIRRLGRSSLTLGQGMFVDSKCVAVAESVMVLMDPSTRRPKPWPEPLARQLRELTAD